MDFSPNQIRHAYGFDQVGFLDSSHAYVPGDGRGTTIAIVDWNDDPNIASDLATFDTHFGIPAPPSFTKVDQRGGTNYPPAGNSLEIALDVEYAHAMAPGANILLVEADSNSFSNTDIAVQYAANQPGVVAVSNSYGALEYPGETSRDSIYTHAGVTYLSSTGDNGAPGQYQAYSPNMVAVGGTVLNVDGSNNWSSESGWSGSGGGISQYENQPAYQNGVVTQSTTQRTTPDLAFDAGASVTIYDTYGGSGYYGVYGTSASCPIAAGLVALVNQGRSYLNGLSSYSGSSYLNALYHLADNAFHDITTGSNQTVSRVNITNGGSGYSQPPTVSFSGGGGSGATGIAIIAGGVVTGVTITNGGLGYTSAPAVTFTGGGGTGATGTAILVGGVAGPGYDLVTGRGTPIVPRFVAGMTGDPVYDASTGKLLIVGGGRDSNDTITLDTSGNLLNVSFNLGNPVPGNGRGGSYTRSYTIGTFSSLEVDTTDGGSLSFVNVHRTPNVPLKILSDGVVLVTLGTGGSAQGVLGSVIFAGTANSATGVTVDDSSDGATHNVTLRDSDANTGEITGLTPQPVFYDYTDAHSISLDTGTGTNTVNVQDIRNGGILDLIGNSAATTVNIGAGDTHFISAGITVTNPHYFTTLNVDDSTDSGGRTATVGTWFFDSAYGQINGLFDTAFSSVYFKYSDTNSVTIKTGTGAEVVNVMVVVKPLTLYGNSNSTTVNVGNNNSMAGIDDTLTVHNTRFYTTLNLNDSADNTSRTNVMLSSTGVTRLSNGSISFLANDLQALTINGGGGTNTYTVSSTPLFATSTLNTGNGNDTVNVEATTGNLVVNTGNGNDMVNVEATTGNLVVNTGTGTNTINLSPTAHNLNNLAGLVTITGQGTHNTLNAYDQATTFSQSDLGDNLYQDHLTRYDTPMTERTLFTYNGMQAINMYAGRGDPDTETTETFGVLSTPAGVPVTVTDAGASMSHVQFIVRHEGQLNDIQGPLTLHGRPGSGDFIDAIDDAQNPSPEIYTVTANMVTRTDMSGNPDMAPIVYDNQSGVILVGSGGGNVFHVQSVPSGTTLRIIGGSGTNTLQGPGSDTAWQIAGSNAGSFTGGVSFSSMQNLTGGAGANTFQFADGASVAGAIADVGAANTLDYSAYASSSVVVDLQNGFATGVGGGIAGANIQSVIGASGGGGQMLYNLLIGNGGNTLTGGFGRRNILVAGGSASTLVGGDGEDLIIAGSTSYDTNPALTEWQAIAAYWTSSDRFATRVSILLSGTGVPILDPTPDTGTVFGNGGGNTVNGHGGVAAIFTDGADNISGFDPNSIIVPITP